MTAWYETPLGQATITASEPPDSDFWYAPIAPMAAGMRVNSDTAMRTSAVFGCVRIISETLASLPLITYRRLERGKERASGHQLYNLLRYRPNVGQTAFEFVEMMTAHALLRGNGYAYMDFDGAGQLRQLIPWHPDRVRVDEMENGRLRFLYRDPKTLREQTYREDEVFHLRGLSLDGRLGVSVIEYQRETIGVTLAAQDYGARFFQNDAKPSLVLKHPGHFNDKEARERFARSWRAAHGGPNRSGTAVLEDGMSAEKLSMSNEDAQFLETRRFQVADVARIFRVPLVLLQETEKSTSWGSGIEQFMLAFVIHCIRPWAVRWEHMLQRSLFGDDEGDDSGEYFVEFLLDALLRGDLKTRVDSYSKGIRDGWMTRNEAREKENMNPLPGLDEPMTQLNMGRERDAGDKPDERPDDETASEIVRREIAAIGKAHEAALRLKAPAQFERRVKAYYGVFRKRLAEIVSEADAERVAAVRCQAVLAAGEQELQGGGARVMELLEDWNVNGGDGLLALMRGES